LLPDDLPLQLRASLTLLQFLQLLLFASFLFISLSFVIVVNVKCPDAFNSTAWVAKQQYACIPCLINDVKLKIVFLINMIYIIRHVGV